MNDAQWVFLVSLGHERDYERISTSEDIKIQYFFGGGGGKDEMNSKVHILNDTKIHKIK